MGYDNIAKDIFAQNIGTGKIVKPASIQEMIPIKDIKNGTIITKDRRYIKVLEVEPSNFPLKDPSEQADIISTFAAWLKLSPIKCQLKICVKLKKRNEYAKRLAMRMDEATHETIKDMYASIISYINNVSSQAAIVRKHYVIFEFEAGKRDNERDLTLDYIAQQLNNTATQARTYFSAMGNKIVSHENEDAFLSEFIYDHLNADKTKILNFYDNAARILDDIDLLNEKREEKGKEKISVDYSNLLAPMGISTKASPEYVVYDGMYHSYYYIAADGYPFVTNSGWLTMNFASIPDTDIDIYYRKQNKSDFITLLGQQMKFTNFKRSDRTETNKDYSSIMDAAESQSYMMEELSGTNSQEDVFYVNTILSVHAQSYEELLHKCDRLEEMAITSAVKLVSMNKFQYLGFEATLPLCKLPDKIYYKSRRNILTTGLSGFYPFTEYELNDPDGVFLGINLYNQTICTLNLYNRDKYSNANMCIFGGSGAGKTYAMSLLANRMVLDGKQVYIITSEKGHEFRRICKALDGTFVKFSSSENLRLNIFDIRPESKVYDELLDSEGTVSWLAKKLRSILGWLELLFVDLKQEERLLLDSAVKKMYAKKGITEDNASIFIDGNDKKPVKEMPIMSDLLYTLKEMEKEPNVTVPERIISMFASFVTGSNQKFNGQTNIDLSDRRKIIVFDLEDMPSMVESATVQLALDFIWGRVKEDPTKQKTIIIEEGWKYLSKGASEESAKLIQEIFKLIRGYGGNAILATQEIGDLVASEYGRSLIECSALKMCMGVEEGAARHLMQHLNLRPDEAASLESFRKGACLLLAGKDHIPLQVQASALEHQLISTDISDYRKSQRRKEK